MTTANFFKICLTAKENSPEATLENKNEHHIATLNSHPSCKVLLAILRLRVEKQERLKQLFPSQILAAFVVGNMWVVPPQINNSENEKKIHIHRTNVDSNFALSGALED